MERLTNKKEADAQRIAYQRRLAQGYLRNIPEERFLRLAAYEDTGLEPEDIETIKAVYVPDHQELKEYRSIGTVEEFRAALRRTAEDDKALPCKVGDTLYEIDLPEYGVITCKVLWINYYNGPEFHVPGNSIVSVWSAHVEVIDGHGKGSTYDFEQGDFGACVFLTRQAAEAALGGGEGEV